MSQLGLIRASLHERKAELVTLMDSKLPAETRSLLDGLFTAPDDQNRYRLTLLKKLSQSTSPSRIKEAVADLEVLSDLYGQLDDILTKLELGAAGIRYFAGSVLKSRMFQLQQRSRPDRHLRPDDCKLVANSLGSFAHNPGLTPQIDANNLG